MKIIDIAVSVDSVNLIRPYTIAFQTFCDVKIVCVRITTAEGIIGYGTGTPSEAVTNETLELSIQALRHDIIQYLIGQHFSSPQQVLQLISPYFSQAPAAHAALDIALFDAFSKYEKKPLVDFLGRHHKFLPTSITIGIKDSLELMITEAKEYIDRGFRVIKLKLGKNIQMDIEYTKALRAAVPKSTLIYVDPNQGYTIDNFRAFLHATHKSNIEFIEQPVKKELTNLLLNLTDQEKKVVCVDESLRTSADTLQWETKKQFPANIFNIKLMKCGGLEQAKKISSIARRNNISLMLGCMDESCVSIAAALHFAYAQPNTKYIDLDGSLDLEQDIFSGGFDIIEGYMHTLNKPGLGVTPA